MAKTEKYLEGLTIHKVPYNIANTSDFKTNVMGKAADNELFIITDTPTFSLKIGNVTYDGTSNVSATTATQSASGLMSAADKEKLDGIAKGATKIKVDTALSNTSTNPVQNKVIHSALSGKAGTSVATTSANGLMSAADKTKLNGIAKDANKTIVDTTLSDSSTNPVQNKVIKTELDKKADKTALDAKADKTALDGKLDKTGGTLTGNLTGKYLTGTWLQTTAATDLGRTPGKVAVLDESGWVYYRTPAEIKSDIGANGYLPTTGGTLTGNLTGKYLTGTWLQTTAATDLGRTPGKVAVLDESGWVYYRTPAEIKSDIGANGYLPTTGGTMTGAITTKGIKLTSGTDFGSSLPSSMQSNQLFFQTLGSNYILDNVYPVGSIYMSVNSTNPKNLFGGTWEQIQGRFLFGMNSSYPAGSTGGEITHALTIDEMPEHNHIIYYPNAGGPYGNANICYPEDSGTNMTWCAEMCKTAPTGGGAAHNNMPPYLSVYIWKRTK